MGVFCIMISIRLLALRLLEVGLLEVGLLEVGLKKFRAHVQHWRTLENKVK